MTNDPFKLARYAGFYKAIQSAGSAGSFGMDAVATPFLNEIVRCLPVLYFEMCIDRCVAWKLDPYPRLLPPRLPCAPHC